MSLDEGEKHQAPISKGGSANVHGLGNPGLSEFRASSKEAPDRTSQSPNPGKPVLGNPEEVVEESEEEGEKSRNPLSKRGKSAKSRAPRRNATPEGASQPSNSGRWDLGNLKEVAETSEEEGVGKPDTTKKNEPKLQSKLGDFLGEPRAFDDEKKEVKRKKRPASALSNTDDGNLHELNRNKKAKKGENIKEGKKMGLDEKKLEQGKNDDKKKDVFKGSKFDDYFEQGFSLKAPGRTNGAV